MSTISTFLPHNKRGGSGSNRRLVQGLAEVLIWARTEAATSGSPGFAAALKQFEELAAAGGDGSEAAAEEAIHRMQTAIRRLRQELSRTNPNPNPNHNQNQNPTPNPDPDQELSRSARAHGFALCTQFALDPTAITLAMIRRGKAGDVWMLQRLARRAGDARVLALIAKRSVNENKAVPYESIGAMQSAWVFPAGLLEPSELVLTLIQTVNPNLDPAQYQQQTDELAQLERSIQRAAVAATIERLRQRLPRLSAEAAQHVTNSVTIACLDGGAINQAAAWLGLGLG